jgi:GntR family transcriptional regulator of vanillate catabolism
MTTQQTRVIIKIREMILQGEIAPGQRLAEIPLAERLSVSRTPVRHALAVLAQEGLLTLSESRGYVVREFSMQEVLDAIDLRGVLEGHAARLVAERGASRGLIRQLHACLEEGDGIFEKGHLVEADESRYADMNERFHDLIVGAAGNKAISSALALNSRVPFAAPNALAFWNSKAGIEAGYAILQYAHRQHHAIVRALERGEGSRVEALMREHANPVKENLDMAQAKVEIRAGASGPRLEAMTSKI